MKNHVEPPLYMKLSGYILSFVSLSRWTTKVARQVLNLSQDLASGASFTLIAPYLVSTPPMKWYSKNRCLVS